MQSRDTLRSTLPLILFAVFAGSTAWACFGERGILTNRTLLQEVEAREADLVEREAAIEHLHEQIHALREDPRVQERWIREELGYVRPGEVLYLFPGDRSADFAQLGDQTSRTGTRDSS
jgi:cell division protein FtsB